MQALPPPLQANLMTQTISKVSGNINRLGRRTPASPQPHGLRMRVPGTMRCSSEARRASRFNCWSYSYRDYFVTVQGKDQLGGIISCREVSGARLEGERQRASAWEVAAATFSPAYVWLSLEIACALKRKREDSRGRLGLRRWHVSGYQLLEGREEVSRREKLLPSCSAWEDKI